jgi:uncharacterized membrane protein YhaH (DUF805 family)
MSPLEHIALALTRSLDVKGRSTRAEFWWFTLAWVLLASAAAAFDLFVLHADLIGNVFSGIAVPIVTVLLFIPHLSLSIRRLHDQNRRGWWLLVTGLPYVGFVLYGWWMSQPGTAGDNRFGPDPLPPPDNPTLYY